MIVVNYLKDGINISGHANYATNGKDIICAAISVLAETLDRSIKELTTDKIQYSMSSGKVDIKYRNLSEKAQTLVDSFFVGIKNIADGFPEYVQLKDKRLEDKQSEKKD